MRIHRRHAPLLFGALLSAIMVAVVSAFVLIVNQGLVPGFAWLWLKSSATTWPIAFPTVTFLAPRVRRFVESVTVD